jgi:hypothetical protein
MRHGRGILRNVSFAAASVRALVISTMSYPETVEMPDSDKILVISHPPGAPERLFGAFPRSARVDRLAGELDEPPAAE